MASRRLTVICNDTGAVIDVKKCIRTKNKELRKAKEAQYLASRTILPTTHVFGILKYSEVRTLYVKCMCMWCTVFVCEIKQDNQKSHKSQGERRLFFLLTFGILIFGCISYTFPNLHLQYVRRISFFFLLVSKIFKPHLPINIFY